MNTQNVSAQLYVKQLTPDPQAGLYGCDSQTYPYLSTCVDNVETDANIENAFQKQLDLSEYYKSPEVFEVMKTKYMDKTMEGEKTAKPQINFTSLPAPIIAPTLIPSGPTDFLKKMLKSSFGAMSNNMNDIFGILIVILIIVVVVYGILHPKPLNFNRGGGGWNSGNSGWNNGNSGRGLFNINL
jgi:hypothetical protein